MGGLGGWVECWVRGEMDIEGMGGEGGFEVEGLEVGKGGEVCLIGWENVNGGEGLSEGRDVKA